ncbi:HLA class II histocompatibility antigen, DM beta chain isoform X1 [Bufo bufo]|uniref:HLA class II histocompatibility antigen, DM beta chain isoform X1 n=1 Tax=Bufo bufo TaxID=8384 RepID=UPI001ABEC3E5|nr:HLA class II histocompatibility antigen, DM beta chain isoform X1 [Bufo bufo]
MSANASISDWTAEMRGSVAGMLLVYSAISLPATGYVMQEITLCTYGDDKQGNITFYFRIAFNHQPVLGYDNHEKMFFPYQSIPQMNEVVKKFTTEFNTKPDMLHYVTAEEKRCKDEKKTFWNDTVERRVKPSMELFSPEQFAGESLPVLICHVWGFYPQNIVVTWIKNENTVVRNETQAVRSGDWTYQVVTKLDLRGSLPEDNYTCFVEHQSLDEPMMKTWKAGLTSVQIVKISVSAVVFGLGLITLIAGALCLKKAKRSNDCHFLSVSCPWRHIFTCLPFSLVSVSREGSITNHSTSSLLSCDSQLLMEEEGDLGEDSETDSMEGELIIGDSIYAVSESPVLCDQGCALRNAVKNLANDRRNFPI